MAIKWVCEFLQGIKEGDFCVRPIDPRKSCRRCDFKALCRYHSLRIALRGQQGGEEGE
jgi:ATP-dependent helicase/DNAse subunit B